MSAEIDYRQFLLAGSLQVEPVADPPMPVWFKVFVGLVFVASVVMVALTGCVR